MTEASQSSTDQQVLYAALTAAAGDDGRTRVGYDEALRQAGSIDQFSRNGELDEARVEAAARGLIEQGVLEVRGPGYKYVGTAVGRSSGRGRAAKRAAGRKRTASRKTAAANGRRRRTTSTARGGARSNARKTAARKTTARATGTRKTASSRGGGSPYLADTLRDLLGKMTDEVSTVSALSTRIDGVAQELQTLLGEYCDRIATLAQLRATTSDGPLAAFLAEELRPNRPTQLGALDKASDRAQAADV